MILNLDSEANLHAEVNQNSFRKFYLILGASIQ